jgi:hypothetical protein
MKVMCLAPMCLSADKVFQTILDLNRLTKRRNHADWP